MDEKPTQADWLAAAEDIELRGWPHVAGYMRRIAVGKVYITSTGEYSDYSATGVFLTKEGAEAYKAEEERQSPPSTNDIAEWDLDGNAGHVCRQYWNASITQQGNLRQGHASPSRLIASPHDRGGVTREYDTRDDGKVLQVCSFISQDHADAIAIEQWQMRLMDGRWVNEPPPPPPERPTPAPSRPVAYPTSAQQAFFAAAGVMPVVPEAFKAEAGDEEGPDA